jgi:thymidylate kinase
MIQLERFHWEGNSPTLIFVIDRDQPFRLESQPEVYQELRRGYRMLAEHAENAVVIDNSGTVRSAVHEIVATIEVESYKV